MKKSDILLVIFIAAAGIVIAYFVCGAVMDEIQPVSFKSVGTVSKELDDPNPEVFNSAALNPTVETYVGSCVDPDQNGELDLAESVLCQDVAPAGKDKDEMQDLLEQVNESNREDGTSNGAAQ